MDDSDTRQRQLVPELFADEIPAGRGKQRVDARPFAVCVFFNLCVALVRHSGVRQNDAPRGTVAETYLYQQRRKSPLTHVQFLGGLPDVGQEIGFHQRVVL